MKARLLQALPVLVGLTVFLAALEVLRVELHAVRWPDLMADLRATSPLRLLVALALTAANYAVLAGYDVLAFEYIGKALPRRLIAGAACMAYAISHNVGFAMLSGASVRYRFYSRWGVTADELSRIVFSYSVTFWLGLFTLGGLSLVAVRPDWLGRATAATVGWLLVAAAAAYLAATAVRRRPLQWRRFTLPLPSFSLAVRQMLVSSIDWALAGAALYVLLPEDAVGFPVFLGSYLVAVLVGMVSHVPGGLGVFEGLMVLLLKPYLSSDQLLPPLLVYRAVYYLLPFTVALVALVADEVRQRRAHLSRVSAWLGTLTEQVTPRALAALTFLAGVVLLFSGATPASPGRLNLVARLLPIGVIEASHFAGSIAGAGLIVLSQALARRLDAAYFLSSALIAIGMAASLLKAFDYEEALLLLVVLAILRRARPAFDRRAAFFATRFSGTWMAAIAGALAASVWLGLFAFKHVEYSHELWWRFELHGEASRFLRASVGAAVVLLAVAATRLLGHAPHETTPPTDADLADAARAIERQPLTSPHLIFLRDKTVVFNDARDAFVMYGVRGRTWVALGDPVGPDAEIPGLIQRFVERADDFGGVPVFYQVGPANLYRYADHGFALVRVGEEAKVDLRAFSLEGGRARRFRQMLARLEKDGSTFRVVPAEEVPAILPDLKAVSDDWLRHMTGAEKGFSLGFFDEAYLSRGPVAVVDRGGRAQAFANLWCGAGGVELSLDLMRYAADAPKDVMDTLLAHLIVWGKTAGYERFALGMAPLSGFEASPVAPLWHRLGGLIYRYGDRLYNFRGLRAYKEKFHPEWEPRYLAYPGSLRLPRVLADVAALIAGGYRRIVLKS